MHVSQITASCMKYISLHLCNEYFLITEAYYRKDSLHAYLHDLHPGRFGIHFHDHRIGSKAIQWDMEKNARIEGTNPSSDQIGGHA